jgi:hypothetical protein
MFEFCNTAKPTPPIWVARADATERVPFSVGNFLLKVLPYLYIVATIRAKKGVPGSGR